MYLIALKPGYEHRAGLQDREEEEDVCCHHQLAFELHSSKDVETSCEKLTKLPSTVVLVVGLAQGEVGEKSEDGPAATHDEHSSQQVERY
jgi:hypothetical protein